MSKILNLIMLILIVFGSYGCSQKQGKVIVPDFLLKKEEPPPKPKLTKKEAKISKKIAIFIIKQDETIKRANLKLKTINYILKGKNAKSNTPQQ